MDMGINDAGNMRGVFLDYAKAAADATERSRRNPFEAEIIPSIPPHWHIVVTHPAHEKIAAAHLIGRRFGVYLPERDKTWITRGRKRTQRVVLYPNYLFLFVWSVEKHMRRVLACTGVSHLLMVGDNPAVISDDVIERIQATEFNETGLPASWRSAPIKKRRRRRRKPGELRDEDLDQPGDMILKPYSAFLDVDLDPAARISELHRALGLAP